MKKYLALIIILILFGFVSCNKTKKNNDQNTEDTTQANEEEESSEQSAALDTLVSRFRASIRTEPGNKKGDHVAVLAVAEQVTLLKVVTVKEGDKDVEYAFVKLSDDSEGYINKEYLANKAIVIINEGTALYNRNNETSGEYAVLPVGTVLMVVDEKANWLKVKGNKLPNGKSIWNKWIKDGYSDTLSVVADGVKFETAAAVYNGNAEGDADKALASLKELAEEGGPIGKKAASLIEGSTDEEQYQYSDGSVLAKITASTLNMRSEPSKDSESVVQISQNAVVAVLEEQDEEIELSGKTGKWTKVNYKGQEGWVFGAWLEKQ